MTTSTGERNAHRPTIFWSLNETLLGCVRLGNQDLDFKIRISDLQSNVKSENGFQR